MRSDKCEIGAPCGYEKTENGVTKTVYPSVLCSLDCLGCPWNPAEMKRRMRTGKWVEVGKVKKLVFRRVE